MSSDKLQAVHEALANVFNQSNLNATGTAASQAAFNHETLSEAFSESHPKAANTEHSFARFDYEALTGIFSDTPTDRPSPTSFDQEFSDMLSERSPLSSNTTPPRPGFDDQAFADLLSEPPPASANKRPPQPSFDHQALAEMLTELSADPISPHMSSPGYDTDPSSAPVPGQIDQEEPKAKAFAVAPPTNEESARQPPRARSLLARLHHLFSTKEETPVSDVENEPLTPSCSGLPHTPEPMARDSSTTDEEELPRPADALRAELPSVTSEQGHKSSHLVGQPAEAKPVASVVAIAPPADTASAWPLQATSLPGGISVPIPTVRESSPPTFERETSNLTVAGRLSIVDQAVAVGAPAKPENARPQPTSLLIERVSPSSSIIESPDPGEVGGPILAGWSDLEQVKHAEKPDTERVQRPLTELPLRISPSATPPLPSQPVLSRQPVNLAPPEEIVPAPTSSTQLENLEPAADSASVPLTNSESAAIQPRQPRLLQNEIFSPDSTSTKPQPALLKIHSSPTIESRQPAEAVTAQQSTSFPLTGLPALVSADTKSPSPNLEQDFPSRSLSGQSDDVAPLVNSVAVAHPIGAEGVLPWHASSLLATLSVLIAKPLSPLQREPFPKLASQPDSHVMPVETVAHSTNAERGLSQQTKSLHIEMPAPVCTDAGPSAPIFEKKPSHGSASYQPTDVELTAKAIAVAPPTDRESAVTRAEQAKSLLAELDLNTAIHLRWVMRDIRSKRTKFSPVSASDLRMLMELGLVEIREELPRLTGLGVLALD